MGSYGIVSKQRHLSIENLDYRIEELENKGFTIIQGKINKQLMPLLRKKIKSIYEKQLSDFSVTDFKKIGDLNTARCPMAYDEYFLEFVKMKFVKDIVQKVLGDNFHLVLQNGIINTPNTEHHQGNWHRDLPYQDYTTSKPIALSIYFTLNNYNKKNGGIILLPGSHKMESLPSLKYLQNNYFQVHCPAGSVIIFNSLLFHKAGLNKSKSDRIGLNHIFSVPIIKQQICIKSIFKDQYKKDLYLNKILGYKWDTPKNVNEYRLKKIEALKEK